MQAKHLGGYQAAAIIALGGFVFGFDAAVISGIVADVTTQFGLNDLQKGTVVSAPTLLAILGSLTVGPLADQYGRKTLIRALALIYTLSAAFSALAWSYESLVLARALGGYAFGSLALAPIYIAELAPSAKRGRLVSFNQMMIVIGLSAAYFSNLAVFALVSSPDGAAAPFAWKLMLAVELLPALAWLVLLSLVPESPRWLMLKGRTGDAQAVLTKLYDTQEAALVQQEIAHASTADAASPDPHRQENGQGVTAAPVTITGRVARLLDRRIAFVLSIGLLLAVLQQITGINAVLFYAPTIFEEAGLARDVALLQTASVGVINVLVTVLAILTIDRLGRRPLMLIGLSGIAVSLALAGYGFHSDSNTMILAGILGFVASFGFSLGPVMWVMLAEIFPGSVRGTAMALAAVVNSATSWLVQFLFPSAASSFGIAAIFGGFSAFAVIGLLLVLLWLPETKGKSLEQLEADLAN